MALGHPNSGCEVATDYFMPFASLWLCHLHFSPVLISNAHPDLILPQRNAVASLDITKAYRNSPILPKQKCYLAFMWQGKIYVQHVVIEGLTTASGIQGSIADACVIILKHNGVGPTVKWVNNFIFF